MLRGYKKDNEDLVEFETPACTGYELGSGIRIESVRSCQLAEYSSPGNPTYMDNPESWEV
jgi:hypothetical protein